MKAKESGVIGSGGALGSDSSGMRTEGFKLFVHVIVHSWYSRTFPELSLVQSSWVDKARELLLLKLLILLLYTFFSNGHLQNCKLSHNYPGQDRNVWLLISARGQKIKPSINWTCFTSIRFWIAVICILLLPCLGVTMPALQTQFFMLNASAPTVFGVCTVKCSKKRDSFYNLKWKQMGNVYKIWLFVMGEFTSTSIFVEKCLSSYKTEVLDECAINS